jgi:hypothetical protein
MKKMSSKIILPIAVAIAIIATAGVMFAIGFDNQPEVTTQPSPPEIVYVDRTVSDLFAGTQEIRKISSESELKDILTASSIFEGNFYDDRVFRSGGFMGAIEETMVLSERAPMPEPMAAMDMDASKAQSGSGGVELSKKRFKICLHCFSKYPFYH